MRNTVAVVMIAFTIGVGSSTVEAGGIGKAITNSALKKAFRRDLSRDMATVAKPLSRDRTVWRYTNRKQAGLETRRGLLPNTHMTSTVHAGRPLSARGAQRKFGLSTLPQARETIRLPKGYPVRFNKAILGKAGVGETTSPKRIPRDAVVRVDPIRGKNGPATTSRHPTSIAKEAAN